MAYSPAGTTVTVPLEFVRANPLGRAKREIVRLAVERNVFEIVVGLPRHLNGSEGASASWVRHFAEGLATMLPEVRLCLLDERRTTMSAQEMLRERGISQRDQRSVIDSTAAQVILGQALEAERLSGMPAGETVTGVDPAGEKSRKDADE